MALIQTLYLLATVMSVTYDFSSKTIRCQVCILAESIKNLNHKPANSQNNTIWVVQKNSSY